MEENVCDSVTVILGVRVASDPKNYLGLSMMVGKRKRWTFVD